MKKGQDHAIKRASEKVRIYEKENPRSVWEILNTSSIDYKMGLMEKFLKIEIENQKDFNEWIKTDNVIKTGENSYKEQTSQWKKTFDLDSLYQFFVKEFKD